MSARNDERGNALGLKRRILAALSVLILIGLMLPVGTVLAAEDTVTVTIIGSSSDGELYAADADSLANARAKATADEISGSLAWEVEVKTFNVGDINRGVRRAYFYFDTSTIPSDRRITDAELQLYVVGRDDDDDAAVYIVSGMPTYPSDPLVVGDFDYLNYDFSTTYGYIDVTTVNLNELNTINANDPDELKTIINTDGTTKLCLIERRDKDNVEPVAGESNSLKVNTVEIDVEARKPRLVITYTTPALPSTGAVILTNILPLLAAIGVVLSGLKMGLANGVAGIAGTILMGIATFVIVQQLVSILP